MEAIHKIYERIPAMIPIPEEVQNRRVEIIIVPLDDEISANGETRGDPDIAQFFGCLPDFPERAPQGEYEIREELE